MSKRKHYSAQEKVAAIRRHLVEGAPVAKARSTGVLGWGKRNPARGPATCGLSFSSARV